MVASIFFTSGIVYACKILFCIYQPQPPHTIPERKVSFMAGKEFKNIYDDGNIPQEDLPQNKSSNSTKSAESVEPLPESFRPRKDGPGGD